MKKFKFLTGDVNWELYGGVWYRHTEDRCYDVIAFHNMEEELGNAKPKYTVICYEIDLDAILVHSVEDALECCGYLVQEARELDKLEAVISYGCVDRDVCIGSNSKERIMKEARSWFLSGYNKYRNSYII